MDYKMSVDVLRTLYHKFLDDFAATTYCFMNGYKMYIYRDNVRSYYCNTYTNQKLTH